MNKKNHREIVSWVIGKRIQKVRQQNNITQAELAGILGCGTSYISEIESGTTNANLETLQTICSFLHIRLCDLLAYTTPAQDFMMPDFQMLFEQMKPDQQIVWKAVLTAYVQAIQNLRQQENPKNVSKDTNGKQRPEEMMDP